MFVRRMLVCGLGMLVCAAVVVGLSSGETRGITPLPADVAKTVFAGQTCSPTPAYPVPTGCMWGVGDSCSGRPSAYFECPTLQCPYYCQRDTIITTLPYYPIQNTVYLNCPKKSYKVCATHAQYCVCDGAETNGDCPVFYHKACD